MLSKFEVDPRRNISDAKMTQKIYAYSKEKKIHISYSSEGDYPLK